MGPKGGFVIGDWRMQAGKIFNHENQYSCSRRSFDASRTATRA